MVLLFKLCKMTTMCLCFGLVWISYSASAASLRSETTCLSMGVVEISFSAIYNRNLAVHPNELRLVWVYNRNLADHPNEPGSVGVYNRNMADHPANQDQLGYTIEATWRTTLGLVKSNAV